MKCCRIQRAYASECVKAFIKLSLECREVEDLVVKLMVQCGGTERHGCAPKGTLERKAQKLLDVIECKSEQADLSGSDA